MFSCCCCSPRNPPVPAHDIPDISRHITNEEPIGTEPLVPEPTEEIPFHPKECCVCLEVYNQDDMIILRPCLHTMCENCVTKHVNLKKTICPICRCGFDIPRGMEVSPVSYQGVLHDHASHIQAAIRMQTNLPSRLVVDIINTSTNVTSQTRMRHVVSELLLCTNLRIKHTDRYVSFFET